VASGLAAATIERSMLSSVLIANRGEIACRIARTARRLRMRTIAVYSDADANALHVRACDEAFPIGPAPARESYLVVDKLIDAAKRARADCIHPGYGFLSENADFAEACAQAGLVFVGPPPDAIRAMGLKDRAKALMEKAGVPVVPGYHGEQQDPKFLKRKAYEIGYPVLIKAVAGGGGKGMRRVDRHADFDEALEGAMREAAAAFGDNRVLIEKYITAPRHIEMQVFADNHGNVIHLNERDCSLQRRHQKVIEEAPAPGMTADVRGAMGRAAVAAAKAVGYSGAGTVEFIVDGERGLRPDGFWFMEMNTRLQVEHPVTESVTGFDLVEWQFRVASGAPLPAQQKDVPLRGHAVEARIYAEDPERGFLPSTGKIVALDFPEDGTVRVDTGVEAGGEVSPYYDPMIAKMIAHAPTREGALAKLAEALDRTVVVGPRTNVGFLAALCRAPDFNSARFDTGFIDRNLASLIAQSDAIDAAAAACGAARLVERDLQRIAARRDADTPASPWEIADAFQLSGPRTTAIQVMVDGKPVEAIVSFAAGGVTVAVDGTAADPQARMIDAGDAVYVVRRGRQTIVRLRDPEVVGSEVGEQGGNVRAPMHGKVLALLVESGEKVTRGQPVAIVEAMKMEHTLTAPSDGEIVDIRVVAGVQVSEGAIIAVIESSEGDK
jgi:3-methylcrotonyl-CoA carboxylase alpha subunit